MTRNTAREIAVHLAYELSFSELPVDEFWISSSRRRSLPTWPGSMTYITSCPTKAAALYPPSGQRRQ